MIVHGIDLDKISTNNLKIIAKETDINIQTIKLNIRSFGVGVNAGFAFNLAHFLHFGTVFVCTMQSGHMKLSQSLSPHFKNVDISFPQLHLFLFEVFIYISLSKIILFTIIL